jgi:hypothetical protein
MDAAALDRYRLEGVARSLNFDGNEYTERCLRPVRVGSKLPSLVDRYALDQRHLDVADHELFGWITQVVDLWRRQAAQGVSTIAAVCAQLLAADEEMRDTTDYREAEWWRKQIRAARYPPASSTAPPTGDAPVDEPRRASSAESGPVAKPVPVPKPSVTSSRVSPPGQPVPVTGYRQSPLPVREVTTEQRDDRVIVRWQVPPGASSAVRFMVERLAGPGVEGLRWFTSGTVVEDPEPPAGRPLVYQVVTQEPSHGTQSKGMEAGVVFTPPVSGLVARQVSSGGVTGRWRSHADIRETRVWRTLAESGADPAAGTPVPSQADRFHDRDAPPGRHVYTVVPIYQDPDNGITYRGEYSSVEVEVFDLPPLPRVEVPEDQRHGTPEIVLRWDQMPSGASLMLRRAVAEPAGAAGDALALEDACRIGDPVAGGEALNGTTACVALPTGHWLLIPFSVAGNFAVRGHSIPVAVVPPVENAEAVRNGANVLVSWGWPEGMRLARVVWRTGDVELVREVTISEFRRLGGVAFQTSGTAEAQVSGLVRSGAEEMISAPVTARVTAQTPMLIFHVHRVWPWQLRHTRPSGKPGSGDDPYRPHGPRWWCARRRIVITADLPCTGLRVEIYVRTPTGHAGSEIPVCALDDLELEPRRPHEVTLTLPDLSTLDHPRYLGCRAATMSGPVRVNEFASTGREIRPCFR